MLDGLAMTYDRLPNSDDDRPPRVSVFLHNGERYTFNGIKIESNGQATHSFVLRARHHPLPQIILRDSDVSSVWIDEVASEPFGFAAGQ